MKPNEFVKPSSLATLKFRDISNNRETTKFILPRQATTQKEFATPAEFAILRRLRYLRDSWCTTFAKQDLVVIPKMFVISKEAVKPKKVAIPDKWSISSSNSTKSNPRFSKWDPKASRHHIRSLDLAKIQGRPKKSKKAKSALRRAEANKPFGILIRVSSDEPQIIVSTMMGSSWECSPRRHEIITHNQEAAKDQSSARPRGTRGRGRRGTPWYSSDESRSVASVPQGHGGRAGMRGGQQKGPQSHLHE